MLSQTAGGRCRHFIYCVVLCMMYMSTAIKNEFHRTAAAQFKARPLTACRVSLKDLEEITHYCSVFAALPRNSKRCKVWCVIPGPCAICQSTDLPSGCSFGSRKCPDAGGEATAVVVVVAHGDRICPAVGHWSCQ